MESTYAPFQTEFIPFLDLSLGKSTIASVIMFLTYSHFLRCLNHHVTPQNPRDPGIAPHKLIKYIRQKSIPWVANQSAIKLTGMEPETTFASRYLISSFFVSTILILNVHGILCNAFDADPKGRIEQNVPLWKPRLPVWPYSLASLSEYTPNFAGRSLTNRQSIHLHPLSSRLSVTIA